MVARDLVRAVAAAVIAFGLRACPEPAPAPIAQKLPDIPAPVIPTGVQLSLGGEGPIWAFQAGVTYELVQYWQNGSNPTVVGRLIRFPTEPAPSPTPPLVDANPGNFTQKVVGWLYVKRESDGSDTQRWLILHELAFASSGDIEIRPATNMGVDGSGNPQPAPTTLADFKLRAESIFNGRKIASTDRPHERTRYVKVRSASSVVVTLASDVPPSSGIPTAPASPTPVGNGLWIGGSSAQLDGGTVGIYAKSNGMLEGLMSENNGGNVGEEQWELADGYIPPTNTQTIVVARSGYIAATGQHIEDLGQLDASAAHREWNVVREGASYYGDTFPSSNP